MKKILSILLCFIISFSMCAFEKQQPVQQDTAQDSKDFSGQYNIDVFLGLIAPAKEAATSAIEYATDEEKNELYWNAYVKAMKEIGFHGGEKIVLNGKLSMVFSRLPTEDSFLIITDKDKSDSVSIYGSYENIAWASLLDKSINVKTTFMINLENEEEWVFSNAEILSPSTIEYKPNCLGENGKTGVVFGKVVDIVKNEYSKQEIESKRDDSMGGTDTMGAFMWYNAMLYSTDYLIIEDEDGNQIGVFINREKDGDVNEGDLIGVKGDFYTVAIENYPSLFVERTLGGFYIFSNNT